MGDLGEGIPQYRAIKQNRPLNRDAAIEAFEKTLDPGIEAIVGGR